MLYNIKGTNISADEHRSYIEKRLASLDKFFGRKSGARADIEIQFMKDEEKMYRAEATLHDHGFSGDFRVEATAASLHDAIDTMINTLTLDLSRAKEKHIHEKRRGAARFKDFIRGFTDRF